MEQTIEDFKESIQQLKIEMTSLKEGEGDDELLPIFDGPLSPEEYYNSKIKILWILMEPYDPTWSGCDYSDWFLNKYESLKETPTWRTLALNSYCIINNILYEDSLEMNKEVWSELKNVAWVNIQKVPRKESPPTNIRDIYKAYDTPHIKSIIQNQIKVYDPNIIICGGTFDIVCKDLNCSDKTYHSQVGRCKYYFSNGKIIIKADHPAYHTYGKISIETYINEIVLVAETLNEKSRLKSIEILKTQLETIGIELNLEIKPDLTEQYGGFSFWHENWKHFKIRFEYYEFYSNDFFYGICKVNSNQEVSKEKEQFHNILGPSDEPTNEAWPWWKGFENKTWGDEVFNEIENSIFIQKIKNIVKDLLEKLKGIEM